MSIPMGPDAEVMYRSPNPDYKATIEDAFPFDFVVERIGASAARLYLREKNRMLVITTSDTLLLLVADRINKVLA